MGDYSAQFLEQLLAFLQFRICSKVLANIHVLCLVPSERIFSCSYKKPIFCLKKYNKVLDGYQQINGKLTEPVIMLWNKGLQSPTSPDLRSRDVNVDFGKRAKYGWFYFDPLL